MSVAFYISGHGFGHASRQVEIINAFAANCPDVAILVRSTAARWLLERTIEVPFDLVAEPTDTGVSQVDSLHLDAAATIAAARDFYATLDARADAEARLLRAKDAQLVICDAPPLACAAAARAGISSVVVSNFTWDWIYQAYDEQLASAPNLIDTIQAAYRQADAAWRLPMHGGFASFHPPSHQGASAQQALVDIPFVARPSAKTSEQTRAQLELPRDKCLVLPSFGGYGVDGLGLDAVDLPPGWEVVRALRQGEVYDAGLSYQDLVRAVDVVMTKPGYGIVSDCLANDTPLVYTSRGRFAEYDVFVREMPMYVRCAYLDTAALMTGRWRAAIETACNAPPPPRRPRTDGASVVADMMARCLRDATSSGLRPLRS